MTIHEPMTVITDYLLAIFAGWWGLALWRDGARRGQSCARLLGACFLVTAVGALLGGTAHGFVDSLGAESLRGIWFLTTVSLGLAGYLMLAAAATSTLAGRARAALLAVGAVKLAVYIAWMTRHHEFHWVILEYGSSMLVVAALMAWLAARVGRRKRAAPLWVLAAIGLSIVGAVIQAARLAPHPNFNHNDLYHVVQMVALYLFYRGGLGLEDRAAR